MTSGSASDTSGTTRTKHDPLCGWGSDNHPECFLAEDCGNCALIDKVRSDERSRWNTPYFSQDYHRGYRQAQQDERGGTDRRDPRIAYAQGYLDALEATSWTCPDCGNTYDPDITECPNRYLDEAKVAVRTAERRAGA